MLHRHALALLAGLAGCPAVAPSIAPDLALDNMTACFDQADWACTIEQASALIQAGQQLGPAYTYRGMARFKQGDLDRCRADFASSEPHLDDSGRHHRLRGMQAWTFSDHDGAQAAYERALAADPTLKIVHVGLANTAMRRGDVEAARQHFDLAIAALPSNANARYGRALLRAQQGDRAGAIEDFDAAIASYADYTAAYVGRGLSKLALAQHDDALLDVRKALDISPNYSRAHTALGRVLLANDDVDGAFAAFDAGLALEKCYIRGLWWRAHAHRAQGALGRALIDLDAALACDANLHGLRVERGEVRLAAGDLAGARTDFEQAVAAGVDDAWTVRAKRHLQTLGN